MSRAIELGSLNLNRGSLNFPGSRCRKKLILFLKLLNALCAGSVLQIWTTKFDKQTKLHHAPKHLTAACHFCAKFKISGVGGRFFFPPKQKHSTATVGA